MGLADTHYAKSPLAKLDYSVDWSQWLGAAETITAVEWTVAAGLAVTDSSHTGTTATVWVSGGSVGTRYSLVCAITTSEGREDARTLYVTVEDR